jgi:hypothetical protein
MHGTWSTYVTICSKIQCNTIDVHCLHSLRTPTHLPRELPPPAIVTAKRRSIHRGLIASMIGLGKIIGQYEDVIWM